MFVSTIRLPRTRNFVSPEFALTARWPSQVIIAHVGSLPERNDTIWQRVGQGHGARTLDCPRSANCPGRGSLNGTGGVTGDTIAFMPMTLRLSDAEADALRRRAEQESRSMQDIARQAVREYVENHSRADLLDQVLDQELPRYAEALERLGQ